MPSSACASPFALSFSFGSMDGSKLKLVYTMIVGLNSLSDRLHPLFSVSRQLFLAPSYLSRWVHGWLIFLLVRPFSEIPWIFLRASRIFCA